LKGHPACTDHRTEGKKKKEKKKLPFFVEERKRLVLMLSREKGKKTMGSRGGEYDFLLEKERREAASSTVDRLIGETTRDI